MKPILTPKEIVKELNKVIDNYDIELERYEKRPDVYGFIFFDKNGGRHGSGLKKGYTQWHIDKLFESLTKYANNLKE